MGADYLEILCEECDSKMEFEIRGFQIFCKRCPCQDESIEESARREERTVISTCSYDKGYQEGYTDGRNMESKQHETKEGNPSD